MLLPLTSYEATTVIATIHHFHWRTNSEGGEMQCLLEALQTRMTLANISSDTCKSCDDAWRPGKLLIIMPCISSLPCVCPLLGRKNSALYGTVGARSIALILLLVPYALHCEMPISSATKLSSHGSVYAKNGNQVCSFCSYNISRTSYIRWCIHVYIRCRIHPYVRWCIHAYVRCCLMHE